MTWQITLNHVCAVLYDISLLAQAYRCMQMLPQTLLFKSAAWHGTFDMIISHLSDLTSPSSDRRCQQRWEMMATLNTNLDELRKKWWKSDERLKTLFNKGRPCGRRGEGLRPVRADVIKKNVVKKLSRKCCHLLKYHKRRKLLKMWLFISCWPTH